MSKTVHKHIHRQKDRQTDRQADKQIERRTRSKEGVRDGYRITRSSSYDENQQTSSLKREIEFDASCHASGVVGDGSRGTTTVVAASRRVCVEDDNNVGSG